MYLGFVLSVFLGFCALYVSGYCFLCFEFHSFYVLFLHKETVPQDFLGTFLVYIL